MSEFVALTADRTVRKFGYADGVGHAFLVPSGFQGDPLAWLSEEGDAPTTCSRTADGARLVEKELGDKMCARCCRVVTDEMVSAAYADMTREPGEGESVADMIMSDPSAVLITLDSALAEAEEPSVEEKVSAIVAEIFAPELGTDGKPWEPGDDPARRVPRGAADAGQKISRQSDWKPVKEVAEAVQCEPNAPYQDRGDGTGTCRSCGWVGPVVETAVEPSVKSERVWCTGGKVGTDGCTACGRSDLKINAKTGLFNKHKTPAVVQEAVLETSMAAHWKHGKAPATVVTDLENELKRKPKRAPLAESPATVDSGAMSADDKHGGAQAGMYRGRTSLTRGSDMTGAVPAERKTGKDGKSRPVPTTNDSKLGRHRTDVSARTDKRVEATGNGVKVVSNMQGGPRGFLTVDEYAELSKNEKRTYRKKVAKLYREAEKRAAQRKALADSRAKAVREAAARKAVRDLRTARREPVAIAEQDVPDFLRGRVSGAPGLR